MPAPFGIREAIDILSEKRNVLPSSSSVDILAVVVSIIKSPLVASATSIRKAEIWITDESLSPDESACVPLWGSSAISRIEQEQIAKGDVIRFNRVSLKKRAQSSNTYCFVHSFEDPEPGLAWFRFSSNNGSSHHRIPENMAMTPQRIQELKYFHQQSGNGSFLLSPLRCKRRNLSEIQSSVGLLSNIAIRVKHHESQRSSPRAIKKRRRSSPVAQSTIGYATVADASTSDVTMTLVDLENRFSGNLRAAKATGQVLMLTNVSSRKQSDVQVKNCALDEVILVPTKASVALLLSKENQTQSVVPQSLPDGTQTQMPYSIQGEIKVVSSILDISIGGKLLQETRCMESPSSFLQNITTPDRKYRDATLHLESFGISVVQSIHSVFASSKIIKTLCGGIDPEELIRDETIRIRAFKLVHALLREQVLLRWTIETSCEPSNVLKVVLPKT
jgi:hypothetical protein